MYCKEPGCIEFLRKFECSEVVGTLTEKLEKRHGRVYTLVWI